MKIHGDLLWFMMTKIVNLKSSAILGVIPLFLAIIPITGQGGCYNSSGFVLSWMIYGPWMTKSRGFFHESWIMDDLWIVMDDPIYEWQKDTMFISHLSIYRKGFMNAVLICPAHPWLYLRIRILFPRANHKRQTSHNYGSFSIFLHNPLGVYTQ